MKIGVFGAGSIGCYVGGKLVAAGHDVVFVGRFGDEIRAHGLTLTDFTGARVELPADRIRYVDDTQTAQLADRDAILVTTKSSATAAAGAAIASALPKSSTCVVVSFQNGVRNADVLRAALFGRAVLAGMVPFNVVHSEKNGRFHNGTSGPLEIERGSSSLVAALKSAGFDVVEHDDLKPVQWSKLLVNLGNSVNALSGLPLATQLRDREYRRIMAALVREGIACLRADGIEPVRIGKLIPSLAPFALSLPNWLFLRVASAMVKVDPEARSSMWEDLERHRTTEIEELNGEIVRLGQKHNVAVPMNERVRALVHEAESAKRGSPKLSAAEIAAP